MYISCSKCNAKFVITPSQIGKGRNVKCSKCGNIWYQSLQDLPKIDPIILKQDTARFDQKYVPNSKGINLPALLPVSIPKYLFISPFILICAIILMTILVFPDRTGFGSIFNNTDLSINDVNIKSLPNVNKIFVEYKILNNSQQILEMPLIRIRLLDKNKKILKTNIHDTRKDKEKISEIHGKQFIEINREFLEPPKDTRYIDITIGNRLDFIIL